MFLRTLGFASTLLVTLNLGNFTQAQTKDVASSYEEAKTGVLDPDLIGSGGDYREVFDLSLPQFRDLVPGLKLVYNSSNTSRGGTDNFVAYGWRLAGLSTIERRTVGGGVPTFDDGQDVFAVDGEELLACADSAATAPWSGYYPLRYKTTVSNASCSTGGNFSTRVESNQRYFYDAAANIWTVTAPNGRRYIYKSPGAFVAGYSPTDPAVDINNFRETSKTRWVLAEVTDSQKSATDAYTNIVTITYQVGPHTEGRHIVPKQISYAGYTVTLNYQTMTAPVAYFGTGTDQLGKLPLQLRSITVQDGAQKIRAYNLVISTTALTGTRRLDRIETYGSNYTYTAASASITAGSKLPDRSFSYSAEAFSFDMRTYPGQVFEGGMLALDDNRDGRDDLFLFGGTSYEYSGSNSAWVDPYTVLNRRFAFNSQRTIEAVKVGESNPCPPYIPDEINAEPPIQSQSNTKAFSVPRVLGDDRSQPGYVCGHTQTDYDAGSGGPFGGPTDIHSLKLKSFLYASPPAMGSYTYTLQMQAYSGNFDFDVWQEVMYAKKFWDVTGGSASSYGSYLTNQDSGAITASEVPAADLNGDGISELDKPCNIHSPYTCTVSGLSPFARGLLVFGT